MALYLLRPVAASADLIAGVWRGWEKRAGQEISGSGSRVSRSSGAQRAAFLYRQSVPGTLQEWRLYRFSRFVEPGAGTAGGVLRSISAIRKWEAQWEMAGVCGQF